MPFSSPGDLPDPGIIESGFPVLQADSLLSEPPGKPRLTSVYCLCPHVINKDNNQHLFEFANYINILFLPTNFSSNIVLPTVFFLILSEVESELGDL